MDNLKKIDECISQQISFLEIETNNMIFASICTIKLTKEICGIHWKELSHSGIYLLEIQVDLKNLQSYDEWKDGFIKKWRDKEYHGKHTPNLKEKRLSKHNEYIEWMPLYLGKAKNISSRIRQHLFLEFDKTTFSLKLAHRKNLAGSIIRISTIKIEVDNYDVIVPQIENQLRDKLNPLAGKQ